MYSVDIYKTSNIFMVREVSKERDFSQSAFRQLNFVEYSGDEFDGDCLAGDIVCSRSNRSSVEELRWHDDAQDAHDISVSTRAHLPNQLPPLFDMEYLPE